MTLTNRVDVQGDGRAIVHVTMAADDQLYSLAQAQGGDNGLLSGESGTKDGWTFARSVTAAGDHVVEASTRISHRGSEAFERPLRSRPLRATRRPWFPLKINGAACRNVVTANPSKMIASIVFRADLSGTLDRTRELARAISSRPGLSRSKRDGTLL
jgi:hypothetical protein